MDRTRNRHGSPIEHTLGLAAHTLLALVREALGLDWLPEVREEDAGTRIARGFKPLQEREAGRVLEQCVASGGAVHASRKWNGWSGLVEINEQGVARLLTRKSGRHVMDFEAGRYFHELASALRAVFICEIVATDGDGRELGYTGVKMLTDRGAALAGPGETGLQLKIIGFYEVDGIVFTRFTHATMRAIVRLLVKQGSPEVELIPELAFTMRVQDGAKTFTDENGACFAGAEALLDHLRDASDRDRSEGWVLWTEHDPGDRPFVMDAFGTPRYRFCVKWKRSIGAQVVCAKCCFAKRDGYTTALVLFAMQGHEFFKCGEVDPHRCSPAVRALLNRLPLFNPTPGRSVTLATLARVEASHAELLERGCALDVTAAWASMLSEGWSGDPRVGALQGIKYIATGAPCTEAGPFTDLAESCRAYPHWRAIHEAHAAAKAALDLQPFPPKRPRPSEEVPPVPAPLDAPPAPIPAQESDPTLPSMGFFLASGADPARKREHTQEYVREIKAVQGTRMKQLDATVDFIVIPYGRDEREYEWLVQKHAPKARLIRMHKIKEARSQLWHRKFLMPAIRTVEMQNSLQLIRVKQGVVAAQPDRDTHFVVVDRDDEGSDYADILAKCAPGAEIIRPGAVDSVLRRLAGTPQR
jgi:hypothetical protein